MVVKKRLPSKQTDLRTALSLAKRWLVKITLRGGLADVDGTAVAMITVNCFANPSVVPHKPFSRYVAGVVAVIAGSEGSGVAD